VPVDVGAVGDEGAVAFEADVLSGGVEIAGKIMTEWLNRELVRYSDSRRLFLRLFWG
jgi:hypothetical protein